MSTLAYAALTTKREQAAPGTSTAQNPPGVKSYVDALAVELFWEKCHMSIGRIPFSLFAAARDFEIDVFALGSPERERRCLAERCHLQRLLSLWLFRADRSG